MLFSRRHIIAAGAALGVSAPLIPIVLGQEHRYLPAVPGRPVPKDSGFGFESTAEEVTAGKDLSGMTALVTGCNSGLGYETMRVLTMRGAHVIGAARTAEKAATACDAVDGRTTPLVVELTDFETVVQAADQVRSMDIPIDMLILNAGIMALQQLEQVNGLEKQFVVNHLGHFLLAEHLVDSVRAATAGRVVVLTSSAHSWAPPEGIQFDNLSGEDGYDPFAAYGQSKVANGLFSRELARRLSDSAATSNSVHPGVIMTNLGRHLPPREESEDNNDSNDDDSGPRWKTIPQGTATTCYVAASPDLENVTGYYFADCNMAYPNHHMQDDAMAARLWQVSEELTAGFRA